MCFHKLVQTGFSTLLLKRKSNGARGLLGNILNLKHTHTHTHTHTFLVLDFDCGYRICCVELKQPLCDNEGKSLRVMEPKDNKDLRIKSPE